MLLSMTGYGEARGQTDALSFTVEIRSVNNRHLKLTLRAPEPYNLLESEFEKVVRRSVRRGTLLIQLRVDRVNTPDDFRINPVALQSYVRQVTDVCGSIDSARRPEPDELFGAILSLPGVCIEPGTACVNVEAEWPVIEAGLISALSHLQRMRRDEGDRMARELLGHADQIREFVRDVQAIEPEVVAAFRDRLRERVQSLLADSKISVSDDDLIREVTIYAERSDVAEELVRLESHLEQFREIIGGDDDSPGRKLEFVTQEMLRETNTLGSKAGHVGISRLVVDIKAVLEKIRELIQNVE